jgi:predicted transposase YdaD
MKTDHWFYGLFQSAPDLITLLLPRGSLAAPSLGPDAPGDALYRFEAPELKAANHRLDGAFWPRSDQVGTPEQPVVLLEVQMHAKPGFKHRLGAQSFRFLQLHPQVQHLAVVVLVPHSRLNLGPAVLPHQLQAFVDGVMWLCWRSSASRPISIPFLPCLRCRCGQKLSCRPALNRSLSAGRICFQPFKLSFWGGFPHTLALHLEELIMEFATILARDLRHPRVAQEWIEEGRQEGRQQGRQEGEATVTFRLLNRRCGPLSDATTARIKTLPLGQLEALAEALLDFSGPADLAAWLSEHGG